MLDFPATALNREPIASVLSRFWDPSGALSFLEVASGSGQHAAYLAQRFPRWSFQPSDLEREHLASIAAYRRALGSERKGEEPGENLLPPVRIDVEQTPWPVTGPYDGLLAINLLHISPWSCGEALLSQAGRLLRPGGSLYLYGAFFRDGLPTAPSNLAFDESLRGRDPRWGLRRLELVVEKAAEHGLELDSVVEMPANNLSALLRRS